MTGSGVRNMRGNSNIEVVHIGTEGKPSPIRLELWNISMALRPEFWTTLPEARVTYRSLGISKKMKNLERALADYPDYEGVDQLKGMNFMSASDSSSRI